MTTKIENWFEKHLNNRFLNPDNITVISFSKSIQQIKNFESLPDNVKEAIKTADHIESKGFQELLGYNKDNKIIWSAGGYWDAETFVLENFGGMSCPCCTKPMIQFKI